MQYKLYLYVKLLNKQNRTQCAPYNNTFWLNLYGKRSKIQHLATNAFKKD